MEELSRDVQREIVEQLLRELAAMQYSLEVQARVAQKVDDKQAYNALVKQMTLNEKRCDAYQAELVAIDEPA